MFLIVFGLAWFFSGFVECFDHQIWYDVLLGQPDDRTWNQDRDRRPMHRGDVPIYDALRRRESWCHSFKKEHTVWLPCQTQSMWQQVQVECVINFHSTWLYMNFQPMWCLCSFAWLGCIHSNFHQWICFLPNIFKFPTIWQTKRPRVIL